MRDRYEAAPTFDAFIASAQQNKALWEMMYKLARVPQSFVDRVRALPGRRHLLVLNEDWCGDAVNTLPVLAKLATLAPAQVDLRVLGRDANPDLMDGHLTGTSRSIPVVILLDDDYVERGWWGPRPKELQAWALGPGRAVDKAERYREIRRWYARDRALSTLEEVVGMMEGAVATSYQSPPSGGDAISYPLSAISSRDGGPAGR
ncbi:MAG: thioredoxin family protein [Gemmatimonadaceae bacterium]